MAKRNIFAWLVGGLTGVALFAFLFLYLRGAFRPEPEYKITASPTIEDPRFPLSIVSLTNALPTYGRMTGFWDNVDDIYTARNAAIRSAQRSIRFETYFMTPGRRADEFAAALIERAQAGVEVQMLIDDFGTNSLPDEYWQQLRNAGVEVRFFRQFDWRAPLKYNSRTHRKLLIIDSQQVLIGGAGVSDDWDGDPDIGDTAPWLEFEVSYEGQVASLLEGNFFQNWAYTGGELNLGPDTIPAKPNEGAPLFVTNDTSTLSESTIRLLFQISFLGAKERVWIGSPYFIPEANTRQALIQAKQNGVDVRVLTMSSRNDKPIVRYAARENYEELLAAGIQICEYQPSMMHAKLALVDSSWVSTGSANFDPRSYFHNDELNISTQKPELIENVASFFEDAIAKSHCLTYAEWQQRPLTERVMGQLGLIAKPLL